MMPESTEADLLALPVESAGAVAREDRRVKIEAEIEEVALTLFCARGFEAVTVDQIAETSGISRRTFFRYFGSKEELLIRDIRRRMHTFLAELAGRPADESVVVSLREAMMSMVASYVANRDRLLRLMQIIAADPDMVARVMGETLEPMDAAIEIVAARMGADPKTDLRPSLIATGILQACATSRHMWLENPDADYGALAKNALDLIEPGLQAMLDAAPLGV